MPPDAASYKFYKLPEQVFGLTDAALFHSRFASEVDQLLLMLHLGMIPILTQIFRTENRDLWLLVFALIICIGLTHQP
jgi:hypothetical protein